MPAHPYLATSHPPFLVNFELSTRREQVVLDPLPWGFVGPALEDPAVDDHATVWEDLGRVLFDGVAAVPGVLGRELFSVMEAGRRLLRHVSGGEGSAVVVLAAATGAAGGAVDHEGADLGQRRYSSGVHDIPLFLLWLYDLVLESELDSSIDQVHDVLYETLEDVFWYHAHVRSVVAPFPVHARLMDNEHDIVDVTQRYLWVFSYHPSREARRAEVLEVVERNFYFDAFHRFSSPTVFT